MPSVVLPIRHLDGTKVSAGVSYKKLRLAETRKGIFDRKEKRGFLPMSEGRGIRRMSISMTHNKNRLFVDMDGTLCAFEYVPMDVLHTPGYFQSLKPHDNVVSAIRMLAMSNSTEVFILSCYLTDTNAKEEKSAWLDKHLPEIDAAHRIFVPCRKNKADYVPGGIAKTDCLLDDFSKNLHAWELGGGVGIKLMNGINGNNGSWTGGKVDYMLRPAILSCTILSYVLRSTDDPGPMVAY